MASRRGVASASAIHEGDVDTSASLLLTSSTHSSHASLAAWRDAIAAHASSKSPAADPASSPVSGSMAHSKASTAAGLIAGGHPVRPAASTASLPATSRRRSHSTARRMARDPAKRARTAASFGSGLRRGSLPDAMPPFPFPFPSS